jgi:hypothetical protein
LFSCNDNGNNIEQKTNENVPLISEKIIETTDSMNEISNSEQEQKTEELISVSDWKIDDFIVKKKDRSSAALRAQIEYTKEQWQHVKNPFTANYQGCDFGDYFHLTFQDTEGNYYDFGFGDNNYEPYQLFDDTDYADNPNYLNKTFKIYWNWKITTFPCCEGEYNSVEAYLPSITKLELISTKEN